MDANVHLALHEARVDEQVRRHEHHVQDANRQRREFGDEIRLRFAAVLVRVADRVARGAAHGHGARA